MNAIDLNSLSGCAGGSQGFTCSQENIVSNLAWIALSVGLISGSAQMRNPLECAVVTAATAMLTLQTYIFLSICHNCAH
ncbi:MAG: hypothetical protein FJ161_00630 [Gammaproteobacteria bacterium]|nr:hypothetical protein [Gammaproteobacteria bacterium]